MQPSNEDILHWQEIAKRRKAILPKSFQFLSKKEVMVTCGKCTGQFRRPLIVGEVDPVYICPECCERNYLPIDWNVVRKGPR